MKVTELKAVMVANEINISAVASHFGINKKFKWEDMLCLDSENLKGILRDVEDKKVCIFHFGTMVFINIAYHEIKDVLEYLKRLDKSLLIRTALDHIEEYRIEISDKQDYRVENEAIVIPTEDRYYFDIISLILAKSVALEKIETDMDAVFDKIEEIIELLNKGNLNFKDRDLSSMSAKVITFKYNTISYIMLLDKPDIVWNNEKAEKVYTDLSLMFELDERYETVRIKTETLMDITQVFSSLALSKRDAKLEWMIIILIIVEILMSLVFQFLK
ncbi:MAG TPA: hypothetical protein DEG71_05070 [Clostridiales bacterium]|nr:hypothetical protein [Clostridiales bacterium]